MAFQWSLAALETLMAEDQMDQHGTVLRAFSVVELWRLRRVCRAFHRWGTAALVALPRVLALGGWTNGRPEAGRRALVLDMSTLRWSSPGVVPDVPEPRETHGLCSHRDGRVVAVGGDDTFGVDTLTRTATQWRPGATGWSALPPELNQERFDATAVALSDGRTMVLGGWDEATVDQDEGDGGSLASVEVLAADGSGWTTLAPMGAKRSYVAAAALPSGEVLVAGGSSNGDDMLDTAELWDPATGAWSALPPIACARRGASACVLPSGRVILVGGTGDGGDEGPISEVFDLGTRTWHSVPQLGRPMPNPGDALSPPPPPPPPHPPPPPPASP
eukprot:COSAG04_NODE_7083_length_1195_cov_2.186131_1_plen_331_part_01